MAQSAQRRGGKKYYAEMARKSHASRIKRNVKVSISQTKYAKLRVASTVPGRIDLELCDMVEFDAEDTFTVFSGLTFDIEPGYSAIVVPHKDGPANSMVAVPVPVVDGKELVLTLRNLSGRSMKCGNGTAACSLIFIPDLTLSVKVK